MIDLALLRLMKHRKEFFALRGRVPKTAIDTQTLALIEDFGVYFKRAPDAEVVDLTAFLPIFRSLHPTLKGEQLQAFEGIIKRLKEDVEPDMKSAVMQSMLELRLGNDMANLLAEWDEGNVPNIHAELNKIAGEFEADANIKALDYIRMNIDELLDTNQDDNGVSWRLQCLNESMRGLRAGDFGIIAGRPDKGKTTFIASEITHMAKQLPEHQTVVWLNNEGKGDRIYMRLLQAALNATPSDIRSMRDSGRGVADAYSSVVGDLHKIRIVDVHGLDTYACENIIKQNNAGMVVFDMIDKIRGFGEAARTDLGLEQMYDWGRELAVKLDFIGLATSQISNEGDGLQFPTLGMLKDSKTGKQGACDFQLMIGASNDPNLAGLRYIGLPKNKLRREGGAGDPRATVSFVPQKARFEDVPITME